MPRKAQENSSKRTQAALPHGCPWLLRQVRSLESSEENEKHWTTQEGLSREGGACCPNLSDEDLLLVKKMYTSV